MVNSSSNPPIRCWLCPLYCFNCDCDKVDLAEGIQIKRISSEFKGYLQKRCSDWFWLDPSDAEYMAVLPYTASVNSNRNRVFDKGIKEGGSIEDLVTAFRLCHAGSVTPGLLVLAKSHNSNFFMYHDAYPAFDSRSADGALDDFIDTIEGAEIGAISTYISKDGADPFASPRYDFRQLDIPQVNELLSYLIKLRGGGRSSIDIALRRFNSAYHGELADRLIDQMIAFESMYLGYDQELKYRLALRVAVLLGGDKVERKTIFGKMRKAYNLRSDIVHGNRQLEWHDLEEIISETEEYLRRSIRRFLSVLSEGYSLESLRQGTDRELAKLDENILSNGELLS
jgi:hypothetical protein